MIRFLIVRNIWIPTIPLTNKSTLEGSGTPGVSGGGGPGGGEYGGGEYGGGESGGGITGKKGIGENQEAEDAAPGNGVTGSREAGAGTIYEVEASGILYSINTGCFFSPGRQMIAMSSPVAGL